MAEYIRNPFFLDILEEDFEQEDEDMLQQYLRAYRPRVGRRFRDRSNPMETCSEEEFRVRFRVTKTAAIELLGDIGEALAQPNRRGSLTPMMQLMIALRFYASGSFQICVGDMAGVSKATVCRVLRRVSDCIARMCNDKISLPAEQEILTKLKRDFFQIARFPGVIGAIDCTHVAIQSPGVETGELFRNRKGFFSKNIQAICGPDLRFHNIVTRWYGSAHDATIFTQSRIHGALSNGRYPADCHLLGDAGYPCKKFLLTPLANPTTPAEQRYNVAHVKTRNTVERAFGVLKRRFACLKYGLRIKNVDPVIVACFILHNVCIEMGDLEPPEEVDGHEAAPMDVPVADHLDRHNINTAKRQQLVRSHFS